MQVTINLRTLLGLVLIELACYVQIVNPTIHWPGIDWIVPGGDAPIKEAGIHVVVFHESSAGASGLPAWWNSDADGSVRRWLETNAKGNWRLLDKDTPLDAQPAWVKQGRASFDAKHGDKMPWIVYSNGKRGGTVALPATAAETLALLDKVKQ